MHVITSQWVSRKHAALNCHWSSRRAQHQCPVHVKIQLAISLPHFDVFRFFLLHENVPGGNGTGVAFWDCFEGSQALNVGFCGSWELLSFQKGDCGAQFWHYSRAPPLKNEPQGGQNHPWHWTGGTPLCTDGVPNVLGHACGVGVTISRPHCSTWDLGLGFEGLFTSKPNPGSIMRQVQISPCHTGGTTLVGLECHFWKYFSDQLLLGLQRTF